MCLGHVPADGVALERGVLAVRALEHLLALGVPRSEMLVQPAGVTHIAAYFAAKQRLLLLLPLAVVSLTVDSHSVAASEALAAHLAAKVQCVRVSLQNMVSKDLESCCFQIQACTCTGMCCILTSALL